MTNFSRRNERREENDRIDEGLGRQLKRHVEHNGRPRSLILVLLLLGVAGTLGGSLGALPLDATGASSTVGRGSREVDVLLLLETNNERRDVDDLLADADVLEEGEGIGKQISDTHPLGNELENAP